MPEGAASHQDGGKLGRPHEVEGLARMDCTRLPPEEIVFAPSGRGTMEKFIHQENLALFRRRLAEVRGESERQVLLKLLAEEEAKEPIPEKGN